MNIKLLTINLILIGSLFVGCGSSGGDSSTVSDEVTLTGNLETTRNLRNLRDIDNIGDIEQIIGTDILGNTSEGNIDNNNFTIKVPEKSTQFIGFYDSNLSLVSYIGKEDEKILLTTEDSPDTVDLGNLTKTDESLSSLGDRKVLLNLTQPQINISKLYDDAAIEKLLNVDINDNNTFDKEENLSIVFISQFKVENEFSQVISRDEKSFFVPIELEDNYNNFFRIKLNYAVN